MTPQAAIYDFVQDQCHSWWSNNFLYYLIQSCWCWCNASFLAAEEASWPAVGWSPSGTAAFKIFVFIHHPILSGILVRTYLFTILQQEYIICLLAFSQMQNIRGKSKLLNCSWELHNTHLMISHYWYFKIFLILRSFFALSLILLIWGVLLINFLFFYAYTLQLLV